MNPIRGLVALPTDCYDPTSFEWTEPEAVSAPRAKKSFKEFEKSVATVVLPEPIAFKSLGETFADLVAAVRGFKRPINPLGTVFGK